VTSTIWIIQLQKGYLETLPGCGLAVANTDQILKWSVVVSLRFVEAHPLRLSLSSRIGGSTNALIQREDKRLGLDR
jgi:hypothetical protein